MKNIYSIYSFIWEEKVVIQEKELISGLSTKEAERRIEQFGLNELQHKEKTSVMKIFLSQFNDFIVWVLIALMIFLC